jgi:hypothetical protein
MRSCAMNFDYESLPKDSSPQPWIVNGFIPMTRVIPGSQQRMQRFAAALPIASLVLQLLE